MPVSSASTFMLMVCVMAALSAANIVCSNRARLHLQQFQTDPGTYTLNTTSAVLSDGRCKIRVGLHQELPEASVDAKDTIEDATTPVGSANYWFYRHWTFVTRLGHKNFPHMEFYNTCELKPSGCDAWDTFYRLSLIVDDCFGALTIEFPRYTVATQL